MKNVIAQTDETEVLSVDFVDVIAVIVVCVLMTTGS